MMYQFFILSGSGELLKSIYLSGFDIASTLSESELMHNWIKMIFHFLSCEDDFEHYLNEKCRMSCDDQSLSVMHA